MATLTEVKTLVVKDADFRRSLFSNPEDTLRSRRLTLNERELMALKADIKNITTKMSRREIDTFFREGALGWND